MKVTLRRRASLSIVCSVIVIAAVCVYSLFTQMMDPRWYSWYLVQQISPRAHLVKRGKPAIGVRARHFTLEFRAQQIQGVGECNYYFGDYRLDAPRRGLAISQIGRTLMGCGLATSDTFPMPEDEYFRLLESAYRYEVRGWELRIYCQQQSVLVFRRNLVPAWFGQFRSRLRRLFI